MSDPNTPHDPAPPTGGGVPRWDEVGDALREAARLDLDAGAAPMPTLFAFAGAEPQAFVTLRPVEPDELLQAFVEVLALLLPLDTDRLGYCLPLPSEGGLDVESRQLLVVRSDAHRRACETRVEVVAGSLTSSGWRWGRSVDVPPRSHQALVLAISVLLERRAELTAGDEGAARLAAQFGRVLLLGHELVLSPETTRRLTSVTTR